jgi:2-methylcitrate dehydratase PrpD
MTATQDLARFAAELKFEAIPADVVAKIEDLLVDWFGSALAGHGSRPVASITNFALSQGPASGPAEVLTTRGSSSPYLAAMANGAASHVAEQDDVHNGSVFHPATVVFPPAVAVAQAIGASGKQLLAASVAGYEVGIRVGEFLGRSHYRIFHTTGTAGALASACWACRPSRCSTPSARPAPRPPACGSSCAPPPTASSCTPRTPVARA